MKYSILIFINVVCTSILHAQPTEKGNAVNITTIEWAPNGKAMVLSIINLDTVGKPIPGTKAYWFDIKRRSIEPLYNNGGAGTVSPDGETIAYARRKDAGKTDIYLFNRITKKETALVVDSIRLFGPVWSSGGDKIAFNRQASRGSPVEIFAIDIKTQKVNQITADGMYKNYNPRWSPKGNTITYFKEKGDRRDQIYLTDDRGSFHKNLTNDTSTQNYYPDWIDVKTIFYTQNDGKLMTIRTDGSRRRELEGAQANGARYNVATKQLAYIDEKSGGTITIFNFKKKTKMVLLTGEDFKRYY